MEIIEVRVLREFRVRLKFADGRWKIRDLGPRLEGRLFGELRDAALFRQVKIEPVGGGLAWPNGADMCPDLLYYDLPSAAPVPRSPRKARPKPRVARRSAKS